MNELLKLSETATNLNTNNNNFNTLSEKINTN